MLSIKVIFSLALCNILCAEAALIKPRIFGGGGEKDPNQFPYMVGLFKSTSISKQCIGGGVILNDRHILTSARAVKDYVAEPRILTAVLGSPVFDDDDVNVISIAKIIVHPDFNEEYLLNDLAMLQTTGKIRFSNEVSAATFPKRDLTNQNGLIADVSGWGNLNVNLEKLKVSFGLY